MSVFEGVGVEPNSLINQEPKNDINVRDVSIGVFQKLSAYMKADNNDTIIVNYGFNNVGGDSGSLTIAAPVSRRYKFREYINKLFDLMDEEEEAKINEKPDV